MIKNAINFLTTTFSSKTARNAGAVLLGNLAGQGINFLSLIVIIRHFTPFQFGLLSTAIAIMGLASQFSDLGISTGFVRYASVYLKEDPRKADILFKITLLLKAGIGLAVMLLGLLLARPLAVYVLKSEELTHLIQLAFIGSFGATLWSYLQSILQVREWFVKYAWIGIFNNSLKLIGTLFLIYFDVLAEINVMWVIAIVPFAGFILDGFLVPREFLKSNGNRREQKEILSELFHFSKWITLATLCTMLLMRIDVFMLQGFSTPSEVGIYSSASQLAMLFPLVTGALSISLLPKISSYKEKKEHINFIVKILKLSPLVLIIFIPLYFFSSPLIQILFGMKYLPGVPVFKILLVSFGIGLILNPIALIFYSINKPDVLSYMNVVQLIIALGLNLHFIKSFGALGAAYTSLLIRVFAVIYISIWLFKYFKRADNAKVSA